MVFGESIANPGLHSNRPLKADSNVSRGKEVFWGTWEWRVASRKSIRRGELAHSSTHNHHNHHNDIPPFSTYYTSNPHISIFRNFISQYVYFSHHRHRHSSPCRKVSTLLFDLDLDIFFSSPELFANLEISILVPWLGTIASARTKQVNTTLCLRRAVQEICWLVAQPNFTRSSIIRYTHIHTYHLLHAFSLADEPTVHQRSRFCEPRCLRRLLRE